MSKKEFSPEYKAKIVIEVLKGGATASEIAARENISLKQIHSWKKIFLENSGRVFSVTKDEKQAKNQVRQLMENEQDLMTKVGQLTIENDWLKKKSSEIFGSEYEKKFTKRPL